MTVGHNDCCHVGGEIHSLVAKESTRKDASGGKHIGKVRGQEVEFGVVCLEQNF